MEYILGFISICFIVGVVAVAVWCIVMLIGLGLTVICTPVVLVAKGIGAVANVLPSVKTTAAPKLERIDYTVGYYERERRKRVLAVCLAYRKNKAL